jgi:sugar lactone lactonase YvrE
MTSTPTSRRAGARCRHLLPVLALATVAALSACTTPGPPPTAACVEGAPPVTLPSASPWAGVLCRQADQSPPASVNGVLHRDGVLWIASLEGGELVAADAVTGEIIGRFGPDQGLATPPDDLAMAADGTIYWTGQATGDIGVLTPGGTSRDLVNLGPGVNPILIGPDGMLYVGRAYEGAGLHRVDPATGRSTLITPGLGLNGFDLGADGMIYAPVTSTVPGRVVRIDPATGRSTTVSRDVGLAVSSAKIPPATRGERPGTLYVLSPLPAGVKRIDGTTGRSAGADLRVPFALADNMTFAPDGRLFITGFSTPEVAVLGVDGRTTRVPIGRR